MNFDCGIYAITSPSGKQYIGQAASFKSRWAQHIYDLAKGRHHCLALQNAYRKYGEGAFIFSKIAVVPLDQLDFREQEQINARPRRALYNIATCVVAPMRGRTHDQKARALISAAKLGEKNHQWRKPVSEETRRKISATLKEVGHPNKGKKLTEEMRAKLLRTGKSHTAESRAKMSLSRKGRVVSLEQRAKQSAASKGRVFSDAHKANISLGQKGKKLTEEHKAKIRASSPRGSSHSVARAVICIDLNRTFGSITEAVQFLVENGKPRASKTSISGACSGKHKSAYGYKWAYASTGEVHAAGEVADRHFWKTPEAA